MKLLSAAESNAKMAKSMGKGFLLSGLSLRPANLSGYEVCAWRTKGCTKACVLEHSGRGNMRNVQDARDIKTIRFFEDRKAWLEDLHNDLSALERKAAKEDLIPVCRLNVASDLPFERIDPTIFTAHPQVRFYDYTKGIKRALGVLPDNYQLTYSWNEESNPLEVAALLMNGRNVTIVFDTWYQRNGKEEYHRVDDLPSTYDIDGFTFPVVDGDDDDIRLPELDGCGVIVGLRGKGGADIVLEGVRSGFILPTIGGRAALAAV